MDITFHCTHCKQELAVESHAAGQVIHCPTCNGSLTVPQLDITNLHTANPMATSAAAKEEKHFVVPVREGPAEILVRQARQPDELEVAEQKMLRMRIIRHTDCVEVGRDRYEEMVTKFLNKVGEDNIVNLAPLTYTHIDIATQKILTDYALQVIYRG